MEAGESKKEVAGNGQGRRMSLLHLRPPCKELQDGAASEPGHGVPGALGCGVRG